MTRLLPLLLLVLVACSVQIQPPPATPESPSESIVQGSFTLSTDNVNNSVAPGGEVRGIPIRVSRTSTFKGEVSFELFGAPEGISGRFEPPSTTNNLSELTLSVSETTPPGRYDLSVRGQSGAEKGVVSDTVQVPLEITGTANGDQPGFSLSLSPSSLQLSPGESEEVKVTFNRRGDAEGAIGLSVSGEPAGVTVDIKSSSQPTLRVNADASAQPGTYTLSVRGKRGDLSSTTQLGLSVSSGEGGAAGSARIQGDVRTANADIPITNPSLLTRSEGGGATRVSRAARPAFVPGQILVQYRTGELSTQAAQTRAAVQRRYGLKPIEAGVSGQPDLLAVSEGQTVEAVAAALQRDPNIRYAEPNYYLYSAALPDDPDIQEQWALPAAGLPVAWQMETGGSNPVVIAILDSGFDLSHEDLAGRFLPGYDFCALATGSCSNAPGDPDPSYGGPNNSHGTLVAGVAGAAGNNARGGAGVAYGDQVKLLPVKLFNDQGVGATSRNFVQGILWAVGLDVGGGVPVNRNPARVINLSLGGDFNSAIVQSAIDEARRRGAVIVAATGNGGRNDVGGGILSPAAAEGVIGVGSINQDFRRSCFSNYGVGGTNGPGTVDIVAPGGEVPTGGCDQGSYGLLSTAPGDRYEYAAGTSFATPMAAGAAALILSSEPNLSVAQVEERLLRGAYLNNTMNRNEYGRGVLRAERSLGLAGPGDQVSVTASGESVADSDLATVTLDLYGGSSAYSLEDLAAGRYRVEASASGLTGEQTLTLRGGERRTGIDDWSALARATNIHNRAPQSTYAPQPLRYTHAGAPHERSLFTTLTNVRITCFTQCTERTL